MKTTCLHCQRTSPDQNLFCQETYCPAETSPRILEYGEQLGDIEIIRTISVLRSSVLYEAQYNGDRVLLKIAHPGIDNTKRLQREVIFLRQLLNENHALTTLPRLLPPYASTTIAKNPYGRVIRNGQLFFYAVFAYTPGDTLRDVLIKNPQLWIYYIGWIVTTLAETITMLQHKGVLHGGISPEAMLISFDTAKGQPKLLLFDLGIVSEQQNLREEWYRGSVLPAYAAPELIDAEIPRSSHATDVYGIGLVFYELLVGRPAFSYMLASDAEIYDMVCQHRQAQMNRFEDVRAMADIAVKATSRRPLERYQDAAELATELATIFRTDAPRCLLPNLSTQTLLLLFGVVLVLALAVTIGINLLVVG